MIRPAFAAIALLGLSSANANAAGDLPCLTPAEFSAISTYSLPSVIRGAGQKCAPSLSSDAFLRTSGETLAHRYSSGRDASWPKTRSAVLKVATAANPEAAKLFGGLPDDTLKPLADQMIQGMVKDQLPADRCEPVSKLLMLLSPLTANSVAEVIALTAGLASRSGQARVGKLSICAA